MTQTFAQIASFYLIATGLGFVVSRDFYERMVMGNGNADPILLNLSGAAHFVLGMIVLTNHFRFGSPGEIGVTLLGFALVAKGAALIIVPEKTLESPKTVGPVLTGSAIGFLAAGLFFLYVGFGPLIFG